MKINKAIALFIVFLLARTTYLLSQESSSTSPIDELFSLAIFPLAAVTALRNWADWRKVLLCYSAFVLVTLLSTAFSRFGGVSQPTAALVDLALDSKLFITILAFYYFYKRARQPERILIQLARVIEIFALINFPFVVKDMLSGGTGLWGQALPIRLGFIQPNGIFHTHVDSTWITLIGTFSALYLSERTKGKIHFLAAIILYVALLAHLSVKEILIASLSAVSYFGLRNRSFGQMAAACFAAVVVTCVFFATPVGEVVMSQFSRYTGSDSQEYARVALTLRSIDIAREQFPLGSGGGTFASAPSYKYGYSDVYHAYGLDRLNGLSEDKPNFITDVFWPKVIGQSGVFGFLLYAYSILVLYISALAVYRRDRSPDTAFPFYIFTAALVISLASTPFSSEFFQVFLGSVIAYSKLKYDRRVTEHA